MGLAAAATSPDQKATSFWKDPAAWLREANFSRGYWIFFAAAFFFDAGFSIYTFLFNLYLLDCHFNERAMGWIGGALTLGSLLGTLPAGVLARKVGLRPVLVVLFVIAPIWQALRVFVLWETAEIGLAFLTGLAMSFWGVCFLPAIARLTTEKNRTAGFSAIFSVAIGSAMLGGIVCGYLRQWLAGIGLVLEPAAVKRLILLASCALVMVGLVPVLRLRMPVTGPQDASDLAPVELKGPAKFALSPFLVRFLPAMALWCGVTAAFTPFANVYLSRNLHVPMQQIGIVFSTVQLLQLGMGIATPIIFKHLGLVKGIVISQVSASIVLGALALATNRTLALGLFLVFSAAQWMSAPGLYNFLMNETPNESRSTAASLTLFSNALAGSVATSTAGALLTRFGYRPVFFGIAVEALGIALLFVVFFSPMRKRGATGSEI